MASARTGGLPSERGFGLLFGGVFLLIALRRRSPSALVVAGLFLAAAMLAPRALAPLNRAWHALGLLLSRVVDPVVMGVLYFLIVTPAAVLARWLGRDELRLRGDEAGSRWVEREPVVYDMDFFKRRF